MNRGTLKKLTNVIAHLFLSVLSVVWVLPIVFVILTSFREEGGTYKSYIIPKGFTLNNYVELFSNEGSMVFSRWLVNTTFVAVFTCIISALFVLSIAYVMSRFRFKSRKFMLSVGMILGMFPGFMAMVAVYYILKGFGLLETGTTKLIALIIVYSAASSLTFYVAKGFFDTIPKTIDEAAYIDGATRWDVFKYITIPLSRPIIVTTLLTTFMAPWIDFIFARVILGQDRMYYTVAIGLWNMLEMEFIQYYYTTFFAGCVVIAIPIAILFLMTQRFYVESVAGSVKG